MQSAPDVHLRAVSLDFLLEFTWEHNLWEVPTRQVVQDIITPATRDFKQSYATCQVPSMHVGPTGIFVSHAWSNSFGLLVGAVRKFLSDQKDRGFADQFLWIDIFAITQHTGPSQLEELAQLESTVHAGGTTLVVLDSAQGIPLQRVWCIYEIFCTILEGVYGKLKVRVGDIGADGSFVPCINGDLLRDMAEAVCVSKAAATVAADREHILRRMDELTKGEREGVNEINRKIKRAVRQGWS